MEKYSLQVWNHIKLKNSCLSLETPDKPSKLKGFSKSEPILQK